MHVWGCLICCITQWRHEGFFRFIFLSLLEEERKEERREEKEGEGKERGKARKGEGEGKGSGFVHKSTRTLWRDVQANFHVPVLTFSIFSLVPCGPHELCDVAPPSGEMLFCGAADASGTELWNEEGCVITRAFMALCPAGAGTHRRSWVLRSCCCSSAESGSTVIPSFPYCSQ